MSRAVWPRLPTDVVRRIWEFDATFVHVLRDALQCLRAHIEARNATSSARAILNAPSHERLFSHRDVIGITLTTCPEFATRAIALLVEDAAGAARVLRSNVLRDTGCDGYAIMTAAD